MILTAIKTLSFRDHPNKTRVALSAVRTVRDIEHLSCRIIVLARDSFIYFILAFGP
jgi:hypothetical protein